MFTSTTWRHRPMLRRRLCLAAALVMAQTSFATARDVGDWNSHGTLWTLQSHRGDAPWAERLLSSIYFVGSELQSQENFCDTSQNGVRRMFHAVGTIEGAEIRWDARQTATLSVDGPDNENDACQNVPPGALAALPGLFAESGDSQLSLHSDKTHLIFERDLTFARLARSLWHAERFEAPDGPEKICGSLWIAENGLGGHGCCNGTAVELTASRSGFWGDTGSVYAENLPRRNALRRRYAGGF